MFFNNQKPTVDAFDLARSVFEKYPENNAFRIVVTVSDGVRYLNSTLMNN